MKKNWVLFENMCNSNNDFSTDVIILAGKIFPQMFAKINILLHSWQPNNSF